MSSRIGGAGGYLHWLKYRERREPCPALSSSAAHRRLYTGPQKLSINQDEMAWRAGPWGPIRTARCDDDLEVPADAEIVIEGHRFRFARAEGPFGESNAMSRWRLQHDHAVTAITHRRAGFASIISQGYAERVERYKKGGVRPVFTICGSIGD